MIFAARQTHQTFCWTILFAAMISFVAVDSVMAQRPGGGRRRGARPTKPKEPPRPRNPQNDEARPPAPGSMDGYILRYKEADEEARKDDEELIGTLKIKPYAKQASVLNILIRRSDEPRFKLGEHVFELDALKDILKKRLNVSVDWDFLDPNSKRDDKYKKKVLRSLTFKTTVVDGEVDEVLDGGRVVVAGTPSDDQQWPDYVPPENDQGKMSDKKVRRKKLKLRVLDDISKFYSKDAEESALSDFSQGDKVRVTVVYAGTKPGFVVKMQPPDMKDVPTEEKPDEARPPAGRPPQPAGPKRGGGRKAPGG